jgi:hypothetical protein
MIGYHVELLNHVCPRQVIVHVLVFGFLVVDATNDRNEQVHQNNRKENARENECNPAVAIKVLWVRDISNCHLKGVGSSLSNIF